MAEETELERLRREASDRAFNERQRGRSPFGNADPYPDVGVAPSAPSVNPDWQSEVPAADQPEAEQQRPALPPRLGGEQPLEPTSAPADTQGYAPQPPAPGSINIGSAWQGGMGPAPDGSNPRYGLDPNAPSQSPYGSQGVYGQTGWESEGGRPAAEPGPAYASDPGDRSRPLRDYRFEGPMPAAGSARHLAEQRAVADEQRFGLGQFGSVNDLADYHQAGYQQAANGQVVQPGPAPTGPMAFLRTGPGSAAMVPDTPQNQLIDLNHRIAQATLSQSETNRSQDLRNAMDRTQSLVNNGTLSPEAGAELQRQIREQGEQLWARQGSLPEMVMRQQFLQMQHQASQQFAIQQEHTRMMNQQLANGGTLTTPEGIRYVITPEGRLHEFAQPRQERESITPAMHFSVRHQQELAMRAEIDHALRTPQGAIELPADTAARLARRPFWHSSPAAFEEELTRRHRASIAGVQAEMNPARNSPNNAPDSNPGNGGGNTPSGTTARTAGGPFNSDTPAADLTAPQRQARSQFQSLQTRIADLTQVPGAERQRLQMLRAQAQNLVHQFGSVEAMPTAERTQYEETDRQLRGGLEAANRIPRRRWWEAFQVH